VFVLEQSVRALFIFHNLEVYLRHITAPTLIMAGDNDVLLPSRRVQQLREMIPQAEVHIIPDAGHLSLLDQPTIFCQRLRQFLVA
jgi:3-oxoadipate enol-lactonase